LGVLTGGEGSFHMISKKKKRRNGRQHKGFDGKISKGTEVRIRGRQRERTFPGKKIRVLPKSQGSVGGMPDYESRLNTPYTNSITPLSTKDRAGGRGKTSMKMP